MHSQFALGSIWNQNGGPKRAIVVETTNDYVGVVYDRVDDPYGPTSQYGVQRIPWADFESTHQLMEWPSPVLN